MKKAVAVDQWRVARIPARKRFPLKWLRSRRGGEMTEAVRGYEKTQKQE
jgi:hypothetical protein